MKFKVGDLVGIGWSGILKRPLPAIVVKVLPCPVYKSFIYVVRTLDIDAHERWCSDVDISIWETDKKCPLQIG